MKSEFAKKMETLAEIIENRDVSMATGSSNPSKFSFVKYFDDDGKERLKCIWSTAVKNRNIVVDEIHISEKGFSAEEWRVLTERFWDYL